MCRTFTFHLVSDNSPEISARHDLRRDERAYDKTQNASESVLIRVQLRVQVKDPDCIQSKPRFKARLGHKVTLLLLMLKQLFPKSLELRKSKCAHKKETARLILEQFVKCLVKPYDLWLALHQKTVFKLRASRRTQEIADSELQNGITSRVSPAIPWISPSHQRQSIAIDKWRCLSSLSKPKTSP